MLSKFVYQPRNAVFQPVRENLSADPAFFLLALGMTEAELCELVERFRLPSVRPRLHFRPEDPGGIRGQLAPPRSSRAKGIAFLRAAPVSAVRERSIPRTLLRETRPKNGMNSHGRVYNLTADGVELLSALLSVLCENCPCGLCVNHLVRPASICSFSLAAAWAAANRAVSTRNGEHDT